MKKEGLHKKSWYFSLLGGAAGILNGLFGSGGGTVVVPMLEYAEIEQKKAHATSIAIILPLSLASALFYQKGGEFSLFPALYYLPLGLVGALIGSKLLRKISNKWLKKGFGVLILLSAVRLWLR